MRRVGPCASRQPGEPRAARLVVRYALILATLPYLMLKAAWVGGSTVGLLDPELAEDPSLFALNLLTLLMDLVVVVLAFALTTRWGLRSPAWLISLPMWVGTGLLTAIGVVTPFDLVAELVDPGSGAPDDGGLPLSPWVPTVVYAGFTVQAILLVVGFGLYAAARWPEFFTARVGDGVQGATHRAQVLLARTFGGFAVVLTLVRVYWAAGGVPGGLRAQFASAVFGLLTFAAAVGVVMLVDRVGARRPLWLPVILVWFGSGTLFAWGLWQTANRVLSTALATADPPALPAAVDLVGMLTGLLVATAATFHLVEQRRDQRPTGGGNQGRNQRRNQAFTQG